MANPNTGTRVRCSPIRRMRVAISGRYVRCRVMKPAPSRPGAVNGDDEVISPVATLTLHLLDRTVTLSGAAGFQDYLNTTAVNSGTLIVTDFTVLK